MTRYAKKTDGNQAAIVQHLRASGFQVIITNFGESFPDILCGRYRTWALIEVKEESGKLSRGQLQWLADCKGVTGVATTAQEAIGIVKNDEGLYPMHQHKISEWLIKNPDQQSLSVKKFRSLINAV